MNDNTRRKPAENPEPPRGSGNDPFSLEAYLARQHAEFASGPTMAEIIEDMDRYRHPVPAGEETIVEALHAVRGERDARLGDA